MHTGQEIVLTRTYPQDEVEGLRVGDHGVIRGAVRGTGILWVDFPERKQWVVDVLQCKAIEPIKPTNPTLLKAVVLAYRIIGKFIK